MERLEWLDGMDVAVTVCNGEGICLYLNARAAEVFAKDGGMFLVGRNLLDCHPEPARQRMRDLLQEQRANSYTIEKNGVRRLVHQTPWYDNGQFAGLVEMSFVLPPELPHFVRGS